MTTTADIAPGWAPTQSRSWRGTFASHLRAAWRLTRALAHVAHGIAIVYLVFPRADRSTRERNIGRWSAQMFRALGVRIERRGAMAPGAKLIVANHVSWLDIMALHAGCPEARFVAMAELKRWPSVVHLADAARTIYLERRRLRDLWRVVHEVARSLGEGDSVAVFPEGVVSEGHDLLPFHGNLLEAALRTGTPVQPVALHYGDAEGATSPAVCFTGDVSLLQSLWRLAAAETVVLRMTVLPPRDGTGQHRRMLAARLRADIADAIATMRGRQ